MLVKTKYFGEIDLGEDKIITFEKGLMGFENFTRYTILFDNDGENKGNIMWFQSVEEPGFALPVISPVHVMEDYDPEVNDDWLTSLGELNDENTCVLLTMTVTEDVKNTTANLKAPLVINADTRKGCQVIAENSDYVVKYNVYDAIQKKKQEKGEA